MRPIDSLDEDRFLLSDLPRGLHRITVEADGYTPYEYDEEVVPGVWRVGREIELAPR